MTSSWKLKFWEDYPSLLCSVNPQMTAVSRFNETWAPSQYPKRRLFVRSRKVSKPRDWYFKLSYRFEIWQAHRQHCRRSACQISERSDNSKYKSRGFETLRDLTERRLFGYWDGAQIPFEKNGDIKQLWCCRLRWIQWHDTCDKIRERLQQEDPTKRI